MQEDANERFATYHAELRPWLWILTKAADCRIFQNKSVPDIIKRVFADLGFTDYRDDTTATYAARDYCVQYNETAFDFVSRLMEDEGIFYFFEHADGKHTLVLADDASAHKPCRAVGEARSTAPPRSSTRTTRRHAPAHRGAGRHGQVRARRLQLRDPVNRPEGRGRVGAGSKMRDLRVSGRLHQEGRGRDARQRPARSAASTRQKSCAARATCAPSPPATSSTSKTITASDANASYVLRWRLARRRRRRATRTPSRRSPRTCPSAPRARRRGPSSPARRPRIVVGKSGEEIWTDKYGRIKVQFHWDQKGKNDEN